VFENDIRIEPSKGDTKYRKTSSVLGGQAADKHLLWNETLIRHAVEDTGTLIPSVCDHDKT
jgi:hypothetical protein